MLPQILHVGRDLRALIARQLSLHLTSVHLNSLTQAFRQGQGWEDFLCLFPFTCRQTTGQPLWPSYFSKKSSAHRRDLEDWLRSSIILVRQIHMQLLLLVHSHSYLHNRLSSIQSNRTYFSTALTQRLRNPRLQIDYMQALSCPSDTLVITVPDCPE